MSALRRVVAVAAAFLAAAVCVACADTFLTDPRDGLTATVAPAGWPAELVVGEEVTLRVTVTETATGAGVAPAAIDWSATPASALSVLHAAGDSARVRATAPGSIGLTATLDDPAFDAASASDDLHAVLAGVTASASETDTLRAFGDTITAYARGLDANGESIHVGGWNWSLTGDALAAIGSLDADSARFVTVADGSAVITATHADCTGDCAATVGAHVRQTPASIDAPPTVSLTSLGATAELTAEVTDARGNVMAGAIVDWTQVDGAGVAALAGATVTAQAAGSARFAAFVDGLTDPLSDTLTVVVTQAPASISLSTDSVHLSALGAEATVTAIVRDAGGFTIGAPAGVTWETTAGAVATVAAQPDDSTSATVAAVGNGAAFVRARIGGLVDEAVIVVSQEIASLVAIAGDGQTAGVGTVLPDSLRLEARDALDSPVAGVAVAWRVTAGGGAVTGTAVTDAGGRAHAAWTLGGAAGAQQVRVVVAGSDSVDFAATALPGPPASVVVAPTTAQLTWVSDTAGFTASVHDAFGNPLGDAVIWSSSATGVATVGSTGVATAVADGTAYIVGTAGAFADSALVTVDQVVASVELSLSLDTLALGESLQLVATPRDSGGATVAGEAVTWTSTDTLVAAVDADGLVTARTRGSATVRASVDGEQAAAAIHVVGWALAFDGDDLVEVASAAALDVGATFTVEAWVRPTANSPSAALVAIWTGDKQGSAYSLSLEGLVPTASVRAATGNTVATVSAGAPISQNAWHHIAFVFDNGTGTLYVDGVQAGSAAGLPVVNNPGTPLRLGADAQASPAYVTGQLDEIRIWNGIRTETEIAAAMVERLVPAEHPSLRAYWRLAEGSGNPVDAVGGLVGVLGGSAGSGAVPAWTVEASPAP